MSDDGPVVRWSWELGPLQSVKPDTLVSRTERDDLEEFFLALALVYNDLKNTALLIDVANKRPTPEGITAEAGQRGGLTAHLHRLAMGILHELLCLLRKYKHLLEGVKDFRGWFLRYLQSAAFSGDSW